MSSASFIAEAQISVQAPVDKVWDAFVDPTIIKEYMFGTTVTSDWKEGSAITWEGTMNGKAYKDSGEILQIVPQQKLQYSHVSPAAGTAGKELGTHIVTIILHAKGDRTDVTLTQDNNPTAEAAEASQKNWSMMLESLKKLLEGND